MPRTSRTVAQRLAAQSRSRKRRTNRTAVPSPAVAEILEDVAPREPVVREPARATAQRQRPTGSAASKTVSTRRPYADYAAEYAHVLPDLRRVAVIAGALLLLLVVLWFFLQ